MFNSIDSSMKNNPTNNQNVTMETKTFLIVNLYIFFLCSCSNSAKVLLNRREASFLVTKIDSVQNVYIILAVRKDSIFKILSYRDDSIGCHNLNVGSSYPFDIESLFQRNVRTLEGTFDITPDAVHGLSGIDFHGASITIDHGIKNEPNDLFEAKNLQGLCFQCTISLTTYR